MMSGTEVALIITSVSTLITALGGFIVLLRKVEVVHKATNSLALKAAEASLAQGTAEGIAIGLKQGHAARKTARKRKRRPQRSDPLPPEDDDSDSSSR